MPFSPLLFFILYGALAAYVHEFIVGIDAMHAGWVPAFAVALITLLIESCTAFRSMHSSSLLDSRLQLARRLLIWATT